MLLSLFTTAFGIPGPCFDDRVEIRTDLPELHVHIGGWESQAAPNFIGGMLLQEKMGVNVKWIPVDTCCGDDYWNFHTGYPMGYPEWLIQDDSEKTRMDVGFNFNTHHLADEVIGKLRREGVVVDRNNGKMENVGVYTTQDVADLFPGIRDYQFLKTNSTVKAHLKQYDCKDIDETLDQEKVTIFASRPSFVLNKYLEKMIAATGDDVFQIKYEGSDENLYKRLKMMEEKGLPWIAALYVPSREANDFDLVRIHWPQDEDAMYDSECRKAGTCDYSVDVESLVYKKELEETQPHVVEFLESYNIRNCYVSDILEIKYAKDVKLCTATCEWLKDNEEVWSSWLADMPELPKPDSDSSSDSSDSDDDDHTLWDHTISHFSDWWDKIMKGHPDN